MQFILSFRVLNTDTHTHTWHLCLYAQWCCYIHQPCWLTWRTNWLPQCIIYLGILSCVVWLMCIHTHTHLLCTYIHKWYTHISFGSVLSLIYHPFNPNRYPNEERFVYMAACICGGGFYSIYDLYRPYSVCVCVPSIMFSFSYSFIYLQFFFLLTNKFLYSFCIIFLFLLRLISSIRRK